MIRRLLAFALAGCMVFESAPLTSYAAGLETPTAVESSEQTAEISEGTEFALGEDVSSEKSTEDKNGSTDADDVSNVTLTKKEDGSYTFEKDGYKVSLTAEEGVSHFRFNASMEAAGGQTLTSSYNLYAYYKEKGSNYEDYAYLPLISDDQYKSKRVSYVSKDTEYSVYFVLKDDSNAILARTGNIVLHTKPMGGNVFVHNTKSTENSITLDVETNGISYNCYYAPTDGSEDEKYMYGGYSASWAELCFDDLQPNTEYYFEFTDYDGKELRTVKASTTESTDTTKAVYTAVTGAESTDLGITLKADVSGYSGDSAAAYLCYTYTNALGVEQTKRNPYSFSTNADEITVAEDGTKSFSISDVIDGNWAALEGATDYEITMWVEFGSAYVVSKTLNKETKTVKTPDAVYDAKDVTLTLTQNAESATSVDYAITRPPKMEDGNEIQGRAELYWRQIGDKGIYEMTPMYRASDGGTTVLQSGAEYEFVLFTGGVKKTQTYTCPETIKLSFVGEGELNPFDMVRTVKAQGTELESLTGTYYIRLYYWGENDKGKKGYQPLGDTVTLNAENTYQAEVKTASRDRDKNLVPDTDYDLMWTLSDSANASDTPICTLYERVHTPKVNISFENEGSGCDVQRYKVTLAKADRANFGNSDNDSLMVYAYIRKAGSTLYRYRDYYFLSNESEYSTTMTFSGLEPETEYEVSLRSYGDYSNSIEYAATKFTTSRDERVVTVTNTSTGLHTARLEYTLTGIPATMDNYNNYVLCYVREKDGENGWRRADWNSYNSTEGHTGTFYISQYNGAELKESTAYEYVIGFGNGFDNLVSELEKTTTGEFTTAADPRRLSGAGVSAGYTSANATVRLSGNDSGNVSYIYFFYRAKGEETWRRDISWDIYVSDYSYDTTVSGLRSGTEYEYVFAVSDSYSCSSPDEVTNADRKVSGTFKTKESKYTLTIVPDEDKITNNKAVVAVTAEGSTEDERISVILTLNNGNSSNVTLKKSTGYKGEVTFTNLLGSTEYTITSAEILVSENGDTETIANLTCDKKFTTKEAKAPTSIKLSQDKIGLNAAMTYSDYEGYNKKTLKVTVEPQDAAADFVWESDNTSVATVSNGVVRAQGAGTAKITATSIYNKDVKATCEVIVKDYVVGAVQEDGTVNTFYYDSYGFVYKGGYVKGIGLYERNTDGSLTKLSNYEVSTDRTGIVSWDKENSKLNALAVGNTRVSLVKEVADGVSVSASFPLEVRAGAKGFGITGFESNYDYYYDDIYPAVAGDKADSYTLAYVSGLTYTAKGELSPSSQYFNPTDFTWTVSDTSVATVSDSGVVTPLKAGDVVLTVTPQSFRALGEYVQKKVDITLHIRELPKQDKDCTIYALANTTGKIGEVVFPADWGEGWKWKYPDTPLVTNNVNKYSYSFEAVYSGTDKYPSETTVDVRIGRITGLYISEQEGNHQQTIEVSDGAAAADKLSLRVAPSYQGSLLSNSYVIDIPTVSGITITKTVDGNYEVTAQKAGNYTINAEVKAKADGPVLAKASYKIKAVEGKQAASITFKPAADSGVTIDAAGKNIIFNKVEDKKDFTLNATVKDRNGQVIDNAVLQWKTSDNSVATVVAASKQDTLNAKVTIKGEGHTVITATAKDARGLSVTLNLEVQNHSPRVDTNKATVNIAYDYNDIYGKNVARGAGSVEIVPVYGEYITDVKLCDTNGQASKELKAVSDSGYKYLITPDATAKTGNYNCKLVVKTNTNTEYSYDLKVSVVDKAPSVSAKMAVAPNMFFKDSTGTINLTTSGNYNVDYVTWEDQSDGANNGFSMVCGYGWQSKSKYGAIITLSQQSGIKVSNGKLTDTGVDNGTLKVKFRAYKKVYEFKNFKIKYNYKKPALESKSASSNVAPTVGQNKGYFYIYDKTNKRWIEYTDMAFSSGYYDELTWDNGESVELSPNYYSDRVNYVYSGKESTKKVSMTLDSAYWREPLKVVHTIKVIKPTAYLSTSQLILNTATKNSVYTGIHLKNTSSIDFADIVIEGANSASKNILDKDLIVIRAYEDGIRVDQSDAKLMGETLPAGTYSYKVTPYYKNPETGVNTALNTLTLKVKVVNNPVTAKVSPKGALDLTCGAYSIPYDTKNYAVLVDPKFSNMGSGYYVWDYRLIGEYSDYFDLRSGWITYAKKHARHYYITARDNYELKAGQAYKLAIEYTIKTGSGDTFTVTSNTFTVKPKQSAPKIKVTNDNQTLYAGNDDMSRRCYLSAPDGYSISSAYGSIDCNKDGKADITVSGSSSSLTVRIADKDGVGASATGKAYSIPVTVKLYGRDGISKDVKVTVKVKVKR